MSVFRRRHLWLACWSALSLLALAVGTLVWDGLHDELGATDLGLVLGNTVYPDGTPSPRLAARLERTLELYRAGAFPLIMVSGALGREGHDEAVVMRDYLVARGVPSAQIIVDSAGVTTFASALNARSLLRQRGLQRVLVVSQYFHVPRARLALKRLGVSSVYSAHARYFEARDLYSVPRELIGYLSYAVRRGEAEKS